MANPITESNEIELTLIDEAAFCRAIGASYRGASLATDNIVRVRFELSPDQQKRLDEFRNGQGGDVDANGFAESFDWTKSVIFGARRRAKQ